MWISFLHFKEMANNSTKLNEIVDLSAYPKSLDLKRKRYVFPEE